MGQVNLSNLQAQAYDIGRAAVFRAEYWDGTTDLMAEVAHLGNTEGEITPESGAEFSSLMLPENLGPAPLKVYLTGEAPTFEFGLFMNPALAAIASPTGTRSGGTTRQRLVSEHTLWIAPEQLFLKRNPTTNIEEEVEIALAGGVFTKDGDPFTAEDQRLFDLSLFVWRGYFERALPTYRHEDGGKALRSIIFHAMPDLSKPEGFNLWMMGADLADSGIDLEGSTS